MRFSLIFLFFLSFNFNLPAQTLSGKVYDTKTVVKDMKVINKTQNILTITNKDGDFSIEAKVNDTISFQSIFYHPLEVVLKQSHFDDINVFEVEEIVSELDEVEIQSEPEQPVFEEETYNQNLHDLIKEDIKRNPGLYQSPQSHRVSRRARVPSERPFLLPLLTARCGLRRLVLPPLWII